MNNFESEIDKKESNNRNEMPELWKENEESSGKVEIKQATKNIKKSAPQTLNKNLILGIIVGVVVIFIVFTVFMPTKKDKTKNNAEINRLSSVRLNDFEKDAINNNDYVKQPEIQKEDSYKKETTDEILESLPDRKSVV